MDCNAVRMPSPVAVRSASLMLSMAAFTDSRFVVGDTMTDAVPA